MKKHLLVAMFCSVSVCAMGQTGWFDNAIESQNTGYYYYQFFNNTLFPDSTVQAEYGDGFGGSELDYVSTNGMGEVFDPKSDMYDNPISTTTPYTVDSIGLVYFYNYVPEKGAAPDTLIFQFYTGTGGTNPAIETGTFQAQSGFPQEPYAFTQYDYHKNLGIGAIAEYKYILKPTDTAINATRYIRVATNGLKGIAVAANDLFAYTVSYRPGFKYTIGDTIDEQWPQKPANLHSHFRVLIGNSDTKSSVSDYEESLTIYKGNRYNIDQNWDGSYIPGTAWYAYNQILWSSFYIQKTKTVTATNDAGIDVIADPSGSICTGTQPVKVHLENYGSKTLTFADIYWTVNGTAQTPYSWTGSLDSGNSAIVTISSGHNFSTGAAEITAYTSSPNGSTDENTSNDTADLFFTVNPLPVVNAGNATTICYDNSTTIGGAAANGYSYNWTSNPAGFSSNSADPTVSPLNTTVYLLTETVNATGCSNSGSVVITVDPLPSAAWTVSDTAENYHFKATDNSLSPSSYVWDFGDGSATETGYSVTHVFPKNTTYFVKLMVTNTNGCKGESDSSINVTVSGIAPGNDGRLGVHIYPNPVTNQLSLHFNAALNEPATLLITDQLGRVVLTKHIDGKMNSYVQDVSSLAGGVYELSLQTATKGGAKYSFVKQ